MTSDTPATATRGAGNKSSTTIGGAVGLVAILGIVIVMCMCKRAQKNREHRRRRWTQNFTVIALPQIMMAGPGNPNYPRRVADDQGGGRADSEVLAKLNIIMESVARLEAEAPPDYASNRS
ncbi:hypothetical protein PQX77_017748 [Marasmius sp. AFHP31]|nr:hypothetical protein PQX77_017748 [Marasmius sp. AFHP31]